MTTRAETTPAVSSAGDGELVDRVAAAILGEDAEGHRLDVEDPGDRLALVRRAAQAERAVRDLLGQSVGAARASGHSWAAIGAELGLSRQAVQQRFGAAAVGATPPQMRRLGPVTALDEMAELELAGRQGWRTVGAGMFYHLVVHTDTQWEHRRVVWTRPAAAYENDGWTVAVRAFPWLYLVRDRGLAPLP